MLRRLKPRVLPELRTIRRTIATHQAELEQLGRHEVLVSDTDTDFDVCLNPDLEPDPNIDQLAATRWEAEFTATRQARDRALKAYLTIHALLALERVTNVRNSRSRSDSWRERLLALVGWPSGDADRRDGTGVAGENQSIIDRERRLFRKRLDALPGDRSALVRAVATELVERDLSDDDRAVLATVLGVPTRAMKTECGHCVQRFLGGPGVTKSDSSAGDGIRVCPVCEFAMPAPERQCASCGRKRSSADP